MKTIELTQGFVAIVDDEDWKHLSRWRWKVLKCKGGKFYACRSTKSATILMHRVVAKASDGMLVDHKNGNGLDNRRDNLRLATQSQNQFNTNKSRGSSERRGVSWHSEQKKWMAQIRHEGKSYFLGRFDSEEDAHAAYLKKRSELNEEFSPQPQQGNLVMADKHHTGNKYLRTIYPRGEGQPITVDVYCVLKAFNVTNPGLQHAIKKLLCGGLRGKASFLQDLSESIDAIERAKELEQEGGPPHEAAA